MDDKQILKQMIKEFEEKVSNYKDKETLIEEFSKSLKIMYRELLLKKGMKNGFFEVDDDLIQDVLKSYLNRYLNYSEDDLRREFIEDVSFNKILRLSNKINTVAVAIVEGKKVNKEIKKDEITEWLRKELELVSDVNKDQAELLVSEAILDLNYIENKDTDAISIRLSRYIKKPEKEI